MIATTHLRASLDLRYDTSSVEKSAESDEILGLRLYFRPAIFLLTKTLNDYSITE